tara:strand:- start:57 stop:239 length:183 start_codon:yes stop_codon:yes gene_type:complete
MLKKVFAGKENEKIIGYRIIDENDVETFTPADLNCGNRHCNMILDFVNDGGTIIEENLKE